MSVNTLETYDNIKTNIKLRGKIHILYNAHNSFKMATSNIYTASCMRSKLYFIKKKFFSFCNTILPTVISVRDNILFSFLVTKIFFFFFFIFTFNIVTTRINERDWKRAHFPSSPYTHETQQNRRFLLQTYQWIDPVVQ